MAEETSAQRAAALRNKIAQAQLERLKSSGNGLFSPPPSQRAKAEEDRAVYNKMQNLREEEAEALEKRASGQKKGGKVSASSRADGCAMRGKTKGRMV